MAYTFVAKLQPSKAKILRNKAIYTHKKTTRYKPLNKSANQRPKSLYLYKEAIWGRDDRVQSR